MEITFTCTSSRRYDLFKRMLNSFQRCCLDKNLITRWIVSDDRSPQEDLDVMKDDFPFLEIYSSPKSGQACNLNNLFSKVKTEWIFHCEDDWEFQTKENFLSKSLQITDNDPRVKNVILRNWKGIYIKSGDLEYSLHYHHLSLPKPVSRECDSRWLGYSLNPGLQHFDTIKKYLPYNETFKPKSRFWDRLVAFRYLKDGYKRANLIGNYINHTGEERTLY